LSLENPINASEVAAFVAWVDDTSVPEAEFFTGGKASQYWSARITHLVQHTEQFGTETGPVHIDMATVHGRKQAMVDRAAGSPLPSARLPARK